MTLQYPIFHRLIDLYVLEAVLFTIAVAIAFSVVILLIADLDCPGQGFINLSQQAMIDVRDWMARTTSCEGLPVNGVSTEWCQVFSGCCSNPSFEET